MKPSENNSWYIIVNPYSSGGKTRQKWQLIEKELKLRGIDHVFRWTEHRGHATELARQGIVEGFRTIVSVGGDGTHNEVVNGILNQDKITAKEIKFAVIHGGTGNDWIRTQRIPKNIKKCISLIESSKTRLQDVGIINYGDEFQHRRYFINAAGFAYDAFVCKNFSKKEGGSGSSLSYMIHILKYLLKYEAENLILNFNDREISSTFYTVNVCIGRFAGGGLEIAPHALIDDGKLAVTSALKMSKIHVLLNLPRFYNGSIGKHSKINLYHTKSILISNKDRKVAFEVDGEYLGEHEARITISPRALRFIC